MRLIGRSLWRSFPRMPEKGRRTFEQMKTFYRRHTHTKIVKVNNGESVMLRILLLQGRRGNVFGEMLPKFQKEKREKREMNEASLITQTKGVSWTQKLSRQMFEEGNVLGNCNIRLFVIESKSGSVEGARQRDKSSCTISKRVEER